MDIDTEGLENVVVSEKRVENGIASRRSDNPRNGFIRQSQDTKRMLILELHSKNVDIATIARAVHMPIDSVKGLIERWRPLLKELAHVDEYRNMRPELVDAAQALALKYALNEKKLEKASFLATVTGFEKLYKISRLENNQSTSNLALGIGKLSPKREE